MFADDLTTIRTEVLDEVDYLLFEVGIVLEVLKSHWVSEPRHFGNTSHALTLLCFSKVDELSTYMRPRERDQTCRMREFLDKYFRVSAECADVAVQMWRHTLVHTSRPREIIEKTSRTTYSWYLTTDGNYPRDQHFRFQVPMPPRVLNLSLRYLVEDLRAATYAYFDDVKRDAQMQEHLRKGRDKVLKQIFVGRVSQAAG